MVVIFGSAADKSEVGCRTSRPEVLLPRSSKTSPPDSAPKSPATRCSCIPTGTPKTERCWRSISRDRLAKIARGSSAKPVRDRQHLRNRRKAACQYLENVSDRVKIYDPSGKLVREVKLPGPGTVGNWDGGWTRDEAFYTFSSFAQPTIIYRYQVSTGKQEEWARVKVPIASDQIEVKQVWYESRDKTRVPMFVVHKKGLKLDGARPTLLTAYGGFNASLTPAFSAIAALWAEMGGVFAQPNLRGGGEFGENWHKAGMLATSKTCLTILSPPRSG